MDNESLEGRLAAVEHMLRQRQGSDADSELSDHLAEMRTEMAKVQVALEGCQTLQAEIPKLRDSVSTLRESLAETKPVGEIVRLLLYFWAAVSVVLGVIGWKQISDIETMIDKQVRLQLPSDKARFAEYSKLIDDTQALYGKFEDLTKNYHERVKDLGFAETVSKEFDIEGQLKRLFKESDEGDNAETPAWRTKAILTLTAFRDVLGKKTFAPDFVFNAAQVCRQLDQYELVKGLTEEAYKRDPSPPNKAMYLASKVAITPGNDRDSAFTELMGMVRNLGTHQAHIVLAEGWNASEATRRHLDFTVALNDLIGARAGSTKPEEYVPSYAYLILAQTYLRMGAPGCVEKAQRIFSEGQKRRQSESVLYDGYDAGKHVEERVHMVLLASNRSRGQEGSNAELSLLRELIKAKPKQEQ